MKKAAKTAGKVLLVIVVLFAVFLVILFIYNRVMLKKESKLLDKNPGQYVEVDGSRMSVYTEGEGSHTLVFLAGWGTSSPIVDFKNLTDKLKDDYKIVVIEKFGYGFSDIVDSERSTDTILRQNREALEKAGVEAPYILCPHSMSGIEGILWAQKYPEEVEAVIGLDPALPDDYPAGSLNSAISGVKLTNILIKLGGGRLTGVSANVEKNYSDRLSADEREVYKALIYKNMANNCLVNEAIGIEDGCKEINSLPKPGMPMLIFSSNGTNAGGETWVPNKEKYVEGCDNIELVKLDCKHAVHNEKPDEISEKIRGFIANIEK